MVLRPVLLREMALALTNRASDANTAARDRPVIWMSRALPTRHFKVRPLTWWAKTTNTKRSVELSPGSDRAASMRSQWLLTAAPWARQRGQLGP